MPEPKRGRTVVRYEANLQKLPGLKVRPRPAADQEPVAEEGQPATDEPPLPGPAPAASPARTYSRATILRLINGIKKQ